VVTFDEGGAFQEVLREIPAKAEFRKNSEVGATLFGLRREAQDASCIPCKVANGRIELRERYFHARTLEYGCDDEIANGNPRDCVLSIELGMFNLFCWVFARRE
jgi:hypothetical protein